MRHEKKDVDNKDNRDSGVLIISFVFSIFFRLYSYV